SLNRYSNILPGFAFANVKPGSILEYRFKLTSKYNIYLPTWDFQDEIPMRYSELSVAIPDLFYFRTVPHYSMQLAKHATTMSTGALQEMTHSLSVGSTTSSDQQSETYSFNVNNETWGMANVPSMRVDSYTSSFENNAQRIS